MNRRQRTAGAIALFGWCLAALSHVLSLRAPGLVRRSRWALRRNQCLFVSSVCMNALVASLVYRFLKRSRR